VAQSNIVSFDLDGTLVDSCFANSVWLHGIPSLYAAKKGVTLDEAKRAVFNEYRKVGNQRLEWYDLSYWISEFGLDTNPDKILAAFQQQIRVYAEVPEVLQHLQENGSRLIILTNARREFADLEIEKTMIGSYFEFVISSTTDFKLTKKTVNVYRKLCKIGNVNPQDLVHVGDDRIFDFEVPRKLGINAFHLDRTATKRGASVIHSLKELNKRVRSLL